MSSLCLHERLGLEMNGAAPITLIDAHHHLWDLDCGRYPWLQGAPDPVRRFPQGSGGGVKTPPYEGPGMGIGQSARHKRAL